MNTKVVFDFEWDVEMDIMNWEIEMPVAAIPRVGESISTGVLMQKDGKPYNADGLWVRVDEVDWIFQDSQLQKIVLRLKYI